MHKNIFSIKIVDDDNDKSVGAQARGFLTRVKDFKFIFFSKFLLILFENTHALVNLLQSKNVDIFKAIQFGEITCSNLISLKNDIDSSVQFNTLYDECIEICESRNINIPENDAKRRKTDNSSKTNAKEKYMNLYDKIIDIFVKEIQERFKPSNLEPVLELFKVIMIEDIKTKINFDILNICENLVNLHDLKLEMLSYIRYKQLNNF